MWKSALWPNLKCYPGIYQTRNSLFGITTPQAEIVMQNFENKPGSHTSCVAHGNIKKMLIKLVQNQIEPVCVLLRMMKVMGSIMTQSLANYT